MTSAITIVGGGVAAAAALRALRDSPFSVCVVAPPRAPGERVGELLSPAANRVLKQLDLWRPFQDEGHRPAHATFSAWGSDMLLERNALVHPEGPGWCLNRRKFETFLWMHARETGATRVEAEVQRIERLAECWRLGLRSGATLHTRFVLDCSGRAAVVARRLAHRHREDNLVAACAFLQHVDRQVQPTPATLIEARPDGWWYSALLPDGRLATVYFSDTDLLPRRLSHTPDAWQALIEDSTFTRARIETAGFDPDRSPFMVSACSERLDHVAGEGWAAAGDAAAAFDPLSSHGLTTALWSGRKAALAACAALSGDPTMLAEYAASMAAGTARYRLQHRAIYALEHRFANRPFWSRRQHPPGSEAVHERTTAVRNRTS